MFGSRESHYGDEYLKLMNIYATNGNKEKAVVLSQRLQKAITESQSNYLSTLEGIFYCFIEIMICSKTIKTAFQIT